MNRIIWHEGKYVLSSREHYSGVVKDTLMFLIDPRGVRKPTWVLKSFPFKSGIFVQGNNTKILFEDADLESVKIIAEEKLQEYINLFI